MSLSFAHFSEVNRARNAALSAGGVPWTGADWSNAMCGEAGEAANVVKKLRRIDTGTVGPDDPGRSVLVAMLADEIGDTLAYLDLLAEHYGLTLEECVVSKFNRISERYGRPERLGEEGR